MESLQSSKSLISRLHELVRQYSPFHRQKDEEEKRLNTEVEALTTYFGEGLPSPPISSRPHLIVQLTGSEKPTSSRDGEMYYPFRATLPFDLGLSTVQEMRNHLNEEKAGQFNGELTYTPPQDDVYGRHLRYLKGNIIIGKNIYWIHFVSDAIPHSYRSPHLLNIRKK